MRWLVKLPGAQELTQRLCRDIDHAATSIVLNVTEGNGRYSELDHRRFLEIAAASVVKAAVYLDLYERKVRPAILDLSRGQKLLSRISAMLESF